jgi:hypothetical protein
MSPRPPDSQSKTRRSVGRVLNPPTDPERGLTGTKPPGADGKLLLRYVDNRPAINAVTASTSAGPGRPQSGL